MKAALISDVHGNLAALEAILEALAVEGVDEIWFLGDAVGYGPYPDEVCLRLKEAMTLAIAGNHDLGVTRPDDEHILQYFRPQYLEVLRWMRAQLSPEALSWLEELGPTRASSQPEVGLFHGSPRDPVWEYVLKADSLRAAWAAVPDRLILVGHSHYPFAFPRRLIDGRYRNLRPAAGEWLDLGEDRWVINPGSVGQPRDDDWRAAAAIIDFAAARVKFIRVEYNVERTIDGILAAGLPRAYASRLLEGS
jgi:predicted phosphodiesterase